MHQDGFACLKAFQKEACAVRFSSTVNFSIQAAKVTNLINFYFSELSEIFE